MKREYVVVCMRHKGIIKDALLFWGTKTNDEEERSLSGYTVDIEKCERFTLEEVQKEDFEVIASDASGIPASEDFAVKIDDLLKWGYRKYAIIA